MATYILMHGTWYDGWCWKHTASHLRGQGHEVFRCFSCFSVILV
jgi:hypothetical protein